LLRTPAAAAIDFFLFKSLDVTIPNRTMTSSHSCVICLCFLSSVTSVEIFRRGRKSQRRRRWCNYVEEKMAKRRKIRWKTMKIHVVKKMTIERSRT